MSERNFYFINLYSHDIDLKAYVLLCILVNKTTSTVDSYDAAVAMSPEHMEAPEYATYKDILNRIQKQKFEGEISRSATSMLIDSLRESFSSDNYMIELMHYLEHEEHERLKELFKQNIIRATGSHAHPTIKTHVHLVSKEDTEISTENVRIGEENKAKKETAKPAKENTEILEEGPIPIEAMVGKFRFILSPVTGKRIDELKLKDRLMVRISKDDEVSERIIKLLLLRDEDTGDIKEIPGSIVRIEKGEVHEFTVKITEDIYATFTEEEPTVKVKMAGQETLASIIKDDDKQETERLQAYEGDSKNLMVYAIIGIIIVLLWIVVSFFVL